MQFIKTHWVLLASSLVALIAIAITGLGMTRTGVVTAMQERVRSAGEIDGLRSNPRNQESIDAEKERGRQFDVQYQATLDAATQINAREPLLAEVFGSGASGDRLQLAYRFQETYKDKLYELPRDLQAGGSPTPQDVQDETERIAEQALRKAAETTETTETKEPTKKGGGAEPSGAKSPTGSADLGEAQRRAAIRKAHSVRIYAEVDPQRSSFHVSPIIQGEGAPTARDMWHAQVGLWIQEDIANAIRKLNDEVAQGLDAKDANVANMAVKRLVSTQITGYVAADGQVVSFDKVGGQTSQPPGSSSSTLSSLTGRKSDAQFDVVRFAFTVIVDERELLKLVDRVTRENFHQLVGIEYTTVPPGRQEGDYYYGEAPVVRATLDFEGYMTRKAYEKMIPADVLTELSGKPAGK